MEAEYTDRGVVHYRLARVLDALGDQDVARERMGHFLENYDSFDLGDQHWIHASANRILGFWHWDKVSSLKKKDGSFESEDDRQEFLRHTKLAIKYSVKAAEIVVSSSRSPDEMPHESDRIMSISNEIFFVVEYIESGGSWSDLEEYELTEARLRERIAEVGQFDEEAEADFHKLNTLRRAFVFLGDAPLSQKYARLALKNLEGAGFYDRGGKTVEEHVIRQCREYLSNS